MNRPRCRSYEGCHGQGWDWDSSDSGSGRTVYCDCEAGDALKEQDRADRAALVAKVKPRCTTKAARWCPNCGDCSAVYTGHDFEPCPNDCPLHGLLTKHPIAPCEDCGGTYACGYHEEIAP